MGHIEAPRAGSEAAWLVGLSQHVGREIGVGEWLTIEPLEEDLFAALIGDYDPMHNDPAWGADTGLGGAVVLGNQVLSMIPRFLMHHGFPAVSNERLRYRPYRLERVRFVRPLPVSRPFRDHARLERVEASSHGMYLVTTSHEVEVKGNDRPFMVAVYTGSYTLL
jgi:acyl dehydratase